MDQREETYYRSIDLWVIGAPGGSLYPFLSFSFSSPLALAFSFFLPWNWNVSPLRDHCNFHWCYLSSEREAGPVSCPESTDRFWPIAHGHVRASFLVHSFFLSRCHFVLRPTFYLSRERTCSRAVVYEQSSCRFVLYCFRCELKARVAWLDLPVGRSYRASSSVRRKEFIRSISRGYYAQITNVI